MRVVYYFQELGGVRIEIGLSEECERTDFVNDVVRKCDLCDKSIEIGEHATLLINDDEYTKRITPNEYGEKYYLHRQCADNSTISYEEYLERIRDYFN